MPQPVPQQTLADGALLVDRADGVATLTFNRPDRLNAMNEAMFSAFAGLIDEAASDRSLRAIVLRGAGGAAFSAGNEITSFVEMATGEEVVAFEKGVRSVLRRFAELPLVTIAAIDGICVGGGLGIATYCDIRVATPHSRFGYPIARTLGNALAAPMLERCVATFGESITREMLLASRLVTADRAYSVGALAAVVEPDELDGFVASLTKGIGHSAPGTIATTKAQLLRRSDALLADDGDEAMLIERYSSGDFREGVRAFTAGEKPTFTGA
jgi:enoyl-CoA hydratase/carnithine racemase